MGGKFGESKIVANKATRAEANNVAKTLKGKVVPTKTGRFVVMVKRK